MIKALLPGTPIGIVGAGTMGAGIAEVAASAGHRVLLLDADPTRPTAAREVIAERLERRVAIGRLTGDQRAAVLARIEPAADLATLAPAGLVIEAIAESLDAKRALFRELESVVATETVLATNTSSLSITEIARPLMRPGRVVGLHFFNPAPAMRLVEVIRGLETEPAVIELATATARALGKEPVVVRSWPGFLVNRVARPFYAEALRLVQEGAADPSTIDAVMREAGGFRMGPFELMDLIGLDVNLAVTRSVFEATHGDRRYAPSWLQEELVRAGHLGRKTGHGFFGYGDGSPRAAPSPHSGRPPTRIRALGFIGPAEPLFARAIEAGVLVERAEGPGLIELDEIVLALTDGRLATERQQELEATLVVFDLAHDFARTRGIALAKADQAPADALCLASGFLQALGVQPWAIDDVPGLVVMRTVAMLANEAAETFQFKIADADEVDRAMKLGVNYPSGPLAWAERVGLDRIVDVLTNLQRTCGEERYRCNPLLRRHATTATSLSSGSGERAGLAR